MKYQKICGPALKKEIERTLNDMRTGNPENAVNNLSGRVNSGPFTQLTQGLVGLLRGDDQKSYFQMITHDYMSNQKEHINKELLKRSGKLIINNVLMFLCMIVMFMVAIGHYLMDTSAGLF